MARSDCIPHLWVVREPTPTYRSKASSNLRRIKVCAGYYGYFLSDHRIPRPVPWIQLKGYWLEAAGFSIDTPLLVKVSEGKLVLTIAEDNDSAG